MTRLTPTSTFIREVPLYSPAGFAAARHCASAQWDGKRVAAPAPGTRRAFPGGRERPEKACSWRRLGVAQLVMNVPLVGRTDVDRAGGQGEPHHDREDRDRRQHRDGHETALREPCERRLRQDGQEHAHDRAHDRDTHPFHFIRVLCPWGFSVKMKNITVELAGFCPPISAILTLDRTGCRRSK